MSKEEDVASKPEDDQEHAQLGASGGEVALQMEGLSGQPSKQHFTEEEEKILEVVSVNFSFYLFGGQCIKKVGI